MDRPPDGNDIVSMIEFQGTIYVATTQRVYRLIDDEFQPVMFVSQPESVLVAEP